MRDHAKEMRRRASSDDTDGEAEVLAKIATMQGSDRSLAERIHALIKANAPHLTSRLWYGMPAYAKDGKVICFFQDARKFKSRYATLGFSDKANLDEGHMWPVAYALRELTPCEVARVVSLLKKAVG